MCRLHENNGPILRVNEGVFGPGALRIGGQYLRIPRAECPALDLHGDVRLSVVAWVKREPKPDDPDCCEFVAGVWNEERAARQYGLFLNLREGALLPEQRGPTPYGEQVCGHVSACGGPTPGYEWCTDASIGLTPVPFGVWQCVGFTYDGALVRSYLDGHLDARPERNPYTFTDPVYDGGTGGADFMIGANAVPDVGIGNFFCGLMGGVAVFDRALLDNEMARLAAVTPGTKSGTNGR